MIAFIRIVASGFLAYVLFAGYLLFKASPAGGVTGTVAFFLSAVVGWLFAFFGDEVAELFDLPPINTVIRGAGVLLLLILAVVAFTQRQA